MTWLALFLVPEFSQAMEKPFHHRPDRSFVCGSHWDTQIVYLKAREHSEDSAVRIVGVVLAGPLASLAEQLPLVAFQLAEAKDYDEFLADPEIPAIARELGIQAPPVHAVAAIELDA